jgi:DNA polymerase III subunit epsilon
MTLPTLPVFYYLDHFKEMLGFVAETYGSILTEEHHGFSRCFDRLSRDAQCLLVRMVNRRGAVFNREHFRYAEIRDIRSALEQLREAGLARSLVQGDYAALLSRLSKVELFAAAKSAGYPDARSSWSKPKLVEFYITRIPFDTAVEYCDGDRFVVLAGTSPIDFQLYLYFGKTEVDLKNFALRDLGLVRTNGASTFSARFEDGDEANACFYYSQLLDRVEAKCADVYRRSADQIFAGPPCPTDYAAELRGRAACRVGQFFEKLGDLELARSLYRAGPSAECRERLVRLVYASGDKVEAEALLARMIDDPLTDEELTFATDFHARKFGGRRTGVCTEMLRAASTIVIDDAHRGNPEAGVAAFKRRKGYRVFFTENVVWLSMFGLIFWDELFESDQLNSGFDWVPRCLKDGTFLRRFGPQIGAKLEAVRSGGALNLVLKSVAAKWGRPNGLFAWNHVDLQALQSLLTGVDASGLATILEAMCRDFRTMRDGFPDLMLAKDGNISFSEVKAEGDVIRRNQLTRLRQLGNAGIPVEIGRVQYRFDPEQDYVVVDVETTGGMASFDRITEIGAVKIRNHQVVGEWQSLLNPQRAIPSKIVQLTGITNEMVRDAPLFASVADSFMEFMADGIFVAHNVNFDYAFISSEFERLEQRFRFPKVCTCVGMRRTHPGLNSYGLANLSRIFGLDLDNHHRALCDARAAAGLLNLMNAKRQDDEQQKVRAA